MTQPSLARALRACAAGLYPAEAAAELLIATTWIRRGDFLGCILPASALPPPPWP